MEAAGAGRVNPAGAGVARRAARHGLDARNAAPERKPAHVQGPCAGHLDRPAPRPVAFADHERLVVTVAVRVEPAGAAVARRGTRHRGDAGIPARVHRTRPGHLPSLAPRAVLLADHERLPVTGAVIVAPAGAALARRGARQRGAPNPPRPRRRPRPRHAYPPAPRSALLP